MPEVWLKSGDTVLNTSSFSVYTKVLAHAINQLRPLDEYDCGACFNYFSPEIIGFDHSIICIKSFLY